ncbi:MAG: hypothetical protein MUO54_11230 [Anaerolineales bacterium]|nr:hypothetical protein [Anaerolineales bacterium]
MFTTNLVTAKIMQEELHRQAENYRLVRSVEKPNPWAVTIYSAIGRLLIASGQELTKRIQTAH